MDYNASARSQVWKGRSGLASVARGVAEMIHFRKPPAESLGQALEWGLIRPVGKRLTLHRTRRPKRMSENGKKPARAARKPRGNGNGKSLGDVVGAILARSGKPMRTSEIAKAARPIWERMGNKPPKHFDGMVWHAVQAKGTMVEPKLYRLAAEGKSEADLRPIGTRNNNKPKGAKKKAKAKTKPEVAKKTKPSKAEKKYGRAKRRVESEAADVSATEAETEEEAGEDDVEG